MKREANIDRLLACVLTESSAAGGTPVRILRSSQRRWASATFVGARHLITVSAPESPMLDDWLAALPDMEFALPGHLVADLIITETRREGNDVSADIEVLTVESH